MDRTGLLRRSLFVNALFSAISGAAMVSFAPALTEWLGLGATWILPVLGIGLLAFSIVVGLQARRRSPSALHALFTSMADLSWVTATMVLAAAWPAALTVHGWMAASCVALAVAIFAVLQLVGVRRLSRNLVPCEGEGRSEMTFERTIEARPETAWQVVSDLEGYAEYSPNLISSRVVKGAGVGLVRECSDSVGRWIESVCQWEEGRVYAVRVQTDAPDYPHPFETLGGRWEVIPAPNGSTVRLRFDFTMGGGILGELLIPAVFVPRFEGIVDGLFDAWEVEMLRMEADQGPAREAA